MWFGEPAPLEGAISGLSSAASSAKVFTCSVLLTTTRRLLSPIDPSQLSFDMSNGKRSARSSSE